MNCPICGSKPFADQKFCRSCGTSLAAQPVAVSAAFFVPEHQPTIVVKDETRAAFGPGPLGFIVLFIGVVAGVIGKMLLHVDMVTTIGVLVSLAGIFLVAYPYVSPRRRQRRGAAPVSAPGVLTPVEPTMKLPPMSDIDFVPSVTERTTDLLKTPAADQAKPQ